MVTNMLGFDDSLSCSFDFKKSLTKAVRRQCEHLVFIKTHTFIYIWSHASLSLFTENDEEIPKNSLFEALGWSLSIKIFQKKFLIT